MTISRKTFIHEILIRMDDKGFVAAHVQDLECMMENGQALPGTAKEGLPRSVTQDEVGSIIGEESARAIETATSALAAASKADARAAEAEAQVEQSKVAAQTAMRDMSEKFQRREQELVGEIDRLRGVIAHVQSKKTKPKKPG